MEYAFASAEPAGEFVSGRVEPSPLGATTERAHPIRRQEQPRQRETAASSATPATRCQAHFDCTVVRQAPRAAVRAVPYERGYDSPMPSSAADLFVGEIRVPDTAVTAPDPNARSLVHNFYQLIAIHQDDRWASVCRELGLASCGDSPHDALARLERVVREAVAAEREGGPAAGWPMTVEELDDWVGQHEGPEAISTLVFAIGSEIPDS